MLKAFTLFINLNLLNSVKKPKMRLTLKKGQLSTENQKIVPDWP